MLATTFLSVQAGRRRGTLTGKPTSLCAFSLDRSFVRGVFCVGTTKSGQHLNERREPVRFLHRSPSDEPSRPRSLTVFAGCGEGYDRFRKLRAADDASRD